MGGSSWFGVSNKVNIPKHKSAADDMVNNPILHAAVLFLGLACSSAIVPAVDDCSTNDSCSVQSFSTLQSRTNLNKTGMEGLEATGEGAEAEEGENQSRSLLSKRGTWSTKYKFEKKKWFTWKDSGYRWCVESHWNCFPKTI